MAVAGAAGVAVAAVVVTGAVVLLPGDTAGIRATADALRPPGGWSLADERVTPPRRLCLGADPCPSLHRTWQVGGNLTERDLQDVVDASGWGLRVDGSCALRPGRPGRGPLA